MENSKNKIKSLKYPFCIKFYCFNNTFSYYLLTGHSITYAVTYPFPSSVPPFLQQPNSCSWVERELGVAKLPACRWVLATPEHSPSLILGSLSHLLLMPSFRFLFSTPRRNLLICVLHHASSVSYTQRPLPSVCLFAVVHVVHRAAATFEDACPFLYLCSVQYSLSMLSLVPPLPLPSVVSVLPFPQISFLPLSQPAYPSTSSFTWVSSKPHSTGLFSLLAVALAAGSVLCPFAHTHFAKVVWCLHTQKNYTVDYHVWYTLHCFYNFLMTGVSFGVKCIQFHFS